MAAERRRDSPRPVVCVCARCGTTVSGLPGSGRARCPKCRSFLPAHLGGRRSPPSWRVWCIGVAITGLFVTDRARARNVFTAGVGSVTDALTLGCGVLLLVAVVASVVHAYRNR